MVPDMEHAEFCQSEHQITAIGRDTRQGCTLIETICCKNEFTRPKCHRLRVEALAIDIVFNLRRTTDDFQRSRSCRVITLEMRTTVVERLAVGCPCREHVELGAVILQVGHLVLVDIIGDKVT